VYALSLTYLRSTSGGKSLLAKGKVQESRDYSAFFDEKGVMDGEAFERWVGGIVEKGMGERN
jgi:signal peptidase complex subunit 2